MSHKRAFIQRGLRSQQCLGGLVPLPSRLFNIPAGGLQIDQSAPQAADGLVFRDMVFGQSLAQCCGRLLGLCGFGLSFSQSLLLQGGL
ncbi:MAG: hypothetical protein J6J81_06030, partial [Oscillospiraceae bacterium]|nr:hypothetical protein [Oscillospiraceae bacterium]